MPKIIKVFLVIFVLFLVSILILIASRVFFQKAFPKLENLQQRFDKIEKIKNVAQPFNHGSRTDNHIALTFDADMTPEMLTRLKKGYVASYFDKRIIDFLRRNKIPATVFVTGLWAETYSAELKDISYDPLFEIGNHSYNHFAFSAPCYKLPTISQKENDQEIAKTQEIVRKLTGKAPLFFRFPGGCYDPEDLISVTNQRLISVGWDVESGDAFNNNSFSIIQKVLKNVQNGSIIVMHLNGSPNAPKTYEALVTITDSLEKRGYIFTKVSVLVNQN